MNLLLIYFKGEVMKQILFPDTLNSKHFLLKSN